MELTLEQRNAVYRAVEAGGLQVKEFALTEDSNYPRGLTAIIHRPSNSERLMQNPGYCRLPCRFYENLEEIATRRAK